MIVTRGMGSSNLLTAGFGRSGFEPASLYPKVITNVAAAGGPSFEKTFSKISAGLKAYAFAMANFESRMEVYRRPSVYCASDKIAALAGAEGFEAKTSFVSSQGRFVMGRSGSIFGVLEHDMKCLEPGRSSKAVKN